MSEPEVRGFFGRDGARLAYREVGRGRPLVLLHGFFTTAHAGWIDNGHADLLASRGHRVILPDLRGHGHSHASHDPGDYPADVLTGDGLALVEHLGLVDYDLGGYSLGGRTTLRMMARGATPRRAVVGGMGLELVQDTSGGGDLFRRTLAGLGTFRRGSPEALTEDFLHRVGNDPVALLHVLELTGLDTPAAELERLAVPVLVLMGHRDRGHGSARALAELLPHGRLREVRGNHISAPGTEEFVQAVADFLD